MGKFGTYKIPLKDLSVGTHNFEFTLDTEFFENIDAPEVRKGNVKALVLVKKTALAFEISFDISGVVQIPCDRCLDDMDQEISTKEHLVVKFGPEYAEESDTVIIVPEAEGEINLAWFMYEFVALNIPMRHVHPAGKCTKSMVSKLKKHLIVEKQDDNVEFLEDDGGVVVDDDDSETEEEIEKKTDPRWDDLKKLIDNN